jgi:quercetin dioxygenase-like cupin family protein
MSHEILPPSFEREDERGTFQEVLNEGHWEALIRGRMKPDSVLGNHYHRQTLIFFYVTSGSARIKTVQVDTGQTDEFLLRSGEGVMLRTGESHAIRFLEESEFIMLKSKKYDAQDPDTYHFPVQG